MHTLTNYERETIINYNEAEETADIFTHNVALIHRLDRFLPEHPEMKVVRREDGMLEVEVPKTWIKVTPPRTYTDEEKAAMVARLKKTAGKASGVQDEVKEPPMDGEAENTVALQDI